MTQTGGGARHLAAILRSAAQDHPGRTALMSKRDGIWREETWAQTWQNALRTAAFFKRAGIRAGDRIAIWSENRPEWLHCDMAALILKAVTVPIYTTLAAPEIAHILEDSGARMIVVSDTMLFEKISALFAGLPKLEAVVRMGTQPSGVKDAGVLRQYALETETGGPDGASAGTASLQELPDAWEDAATIIYTSGTTGVPKGVVLTHGNFLSNMIFVDRVIHLKETDTHLSFLPLSHVFERLCGYYLAVHRGCTIAYAQNLEAVPDNLREVRPTVIMAVPRFYEKILCKIEDSVAQTPPLRQKIFTWARRVGERASLLKLAGKPLGTSLAVQHAVAEKLVYRKVAERLGGRVRFCVSGGAPLAEHVAHFFYLLGIVIIEGYGLTETSPVIACNRLDAFRFGTVGKPIDGIEVRIAEDGEILTRGPCVMRGYYNLPEATAACTEGGWFHTGDLGSIDTDGFLRITGRKKEIIVTSGGKKISTQLVEAVFERDPAVLRCILYGDGRNFLTALVVPNLSEIRRQAEAQGVQLPAAVPELCASEWVNGYVRKVIDAAQSGLAPFEQIKYFVLLEKDFSVDAGELTPTQKPRRTVIFKKYGALLEPFYRKKP